MPYAIKEIFYSLQGEGYHAGRPTVFCRFSGCNLWSGLEKHRSKAICTFCDTDFVGVDGTFGKKYASPQSLVAQLRALWPDSTTPPYIVFTGGEPTLQLDEKLIEACKQEGFIMGIETNGTKKVVPGIDWICVSPKPNAPLKQTSGHELKLIFPQKEREMMPHHFTDLDFEHFYLQPMDNTQSQENTQAVVDYCLKHPAWKVSFQLHKTLGLR